MKTIKNTTKRLITIAARLSRGNSDLRTDTTKMSSNVRKVNFHPGINDIDQKDFDLIKDIKFFDDLVTCGYLEIFGHAPSKNQVQYLNEQIEIEKKKAADLEKKLKEVESEKKENKKSAEVKSNNMDPKISD